LLGIAVASAARHGVIAQLDLEPEHLTPAGAVSPSVVMALADSANAAGAALSLPPGSAVRTIECKTSFLADGEGRVLRAEAAPLHVNAGVAVWRAAVFRDGRQIADVTQTHMAVEAGAGAARSAAAEAAPGFARSGLAAKFSTAVVDARWRQILDGATKVIAAKGFDKATIREIAAAAEMPVPTMYQYLDRKEDILYNIYRFFMTEVVTALAGWRAADLPPRERLAGAIRTVVDVFDRNHRLIKMMFQETRALTPEARRQVYALDAQYIAIFRELLAGAPHEGDPAARDTELAANFVYFLCTIWPLRFWSIGRYGRAAVADAIIDFVLNGIGAAPPAPAGDGSSPGSPA